MPNALTEAEIQKIIPLIEQTKWHYQLDRFTNEQLNDINVSVNRARREISSKLNTINPESKFTKERLNALAEEMQDMTVAVRSQISGKIEGIVLEAGLKSYPKQAEIMSFGGLVPNFNAVQLSANQLKSIVNTQVGGKLLDEWVDTAFDANVKEKFKSEITTGMLKGEGYKNIVNRFKTEAFDGFERDVESLTRTQVQSINTRAMTDTMKANEDIVKGWKWSSVYENRSCIRCISLDAKGEVYPIEGGPNIPLHVNCRCFQEPVTKTFRELGVDIDEVEEAYKPYTIRGKIDPVTGKVIPGKIGVGGGRIIDTGRFLGNYEDFFKQLPENVQLQMLGPTRLGLYKEGKLTLAGLTDEKGGAFLIDELKGGKKSLNTSNKKLYDRLSLEVQELRDKGTFPLDKSAEERVIQTAIKANELYGDPSKSESVAFWVESPSIYHGKHMFTGEKHRFGDAFQKEILSNTLKEDGILYRGVNKGMLTGLRVGDLLETEGGFTATSMSKDIAEIFKQGDNGFLMKISVKKGQPALHVHTIASELVLPAGAELRVVSIAGDVYEFEYIAKEAAEKLAKEAVQLTSTQQKILDFANTKPSKKFLSSEDIINRYNKAVNEKDRITLKDFEVLQKRFADEVPLCMNRELRKGSNSYEALLETGEFKNQFQLANKATSSGYKDPVVSGRRDSWEMTYANNLFKESAEYSKLSDGDFLTSELAFERPIYGYFNDSGVDNRLSGQYGDATFVLNQNAKKRTTLTSLNTSKFDSGLNTLQTPFNSNEVLDKFLTNKAQAFLQKKTSKIINFSGSDYVEAQIFGGIKLDRDVEKIITLRRAPHIEALAKKWNIPYEIEDE